MDIPKQLAIRTSITSQGLDDITKLLGSEKDGAA